MGIYLALHRPKVIIHGLFKSKVAPTYGLKDIPYKGLNMDQNALLNNRDIISGGEENKIGGNTKMSACTKIILINIALSILSIVSNAAVDVTLPIYMGFLVQSGSSPFYGAACVMFWICFIFNALNIIFFIRSKWKNEDATLLPLVTWKSVIITGFLVASMAILLCFTSLPTRTPPYLQSILVSTITPFTVLFRYLILRKSE